MDITCFLYRKTNKNSHISKGKHNQRSKRPNILIYYLEYTTITPPGHACE